MEYTVGSLADLISGNNTPNKPKVTKITITENNNNQEDGSLIKKKIKNSDVIKKAKKRKSSNLIHSQNNKRRKIKSSDTLANNEEENKFEKKTNNLKQKRKPETVKKEYDVEELVRTIFVGNVPIKMEKKKLKKHFKKYGPIESLRFRGIPVANPKVSKKVAAIKKEFHPDRSSVHCYIRFVNKEDAQKALQENGCLFDEHHLRVQACDVKEKPDESKAIFIGNLSFEAEEEELWKLFESCGSISNIRIVRDSNTGMGKGFAYVNFTDSDAVQLALEMENVTLRNRVLRISLSSVNSAKKKKMNPKIKKNQNNRSIKKNEEQNGSNEVKNKWKKSTSVQNKSFQGSTLKLKKKHKVNKGTQNKKRNIKKIAPASK